MNMLVKTIHLIIATTLAGLTVANYFYYLINLKNPVTVKFSSKYTLIADIAIILPLIILSFLTGSALVYLMHLSFDTLWIQAAYYLMTLILILHFFIIVLKKIEQFKLLLHINYWLIFLCYITIIHDAIMHRTYLL